MNKHLGKKFNDRNQGNYKILWRLGGGFLPFLQVLSANADYPFAPHLINQTKIRDIL
jgi:hypothetical protein